MWGMKLVLAAVLTAALSAFAVPSAMIAPASGTTVSAAATDACGAQPLKADGTPWSCTFDDEFSGTALDRTRWVPQAVFGTGGVTGRACYLDSPSTIAVANGSLNLT